MKQEIEHKNYKPVAFNHNYRRFIQELINRLPADQRAGVRSLNKHSLAGFSFNNNSGSNRFNNDEKAPYINFLAGVSPDLSDEDFAKMTTGLLVSLQANLTELGKRLPVHSRATSSYQGAIADKHNMIKIAPTAKVITTEESNAIKKHFSHKLLKNDNNLAGLAIAHDFLHALIESKGHLPTNYLAGLVIAEHAKHNPVYASKVSPQLAKEVMKTIAFNKDVHKTVVPDPSLSQGASDDQNFTGYVQVIICVATMLGSLLTSSSPNGGSVFGSIMSKLGLSDKKPENTELAKALEKQQIYYLTDAEGMRVRPFRDLVIKKGAPLVDKAIDAKLNEALFKTWYTVQKEKIADNKAMSTIRDVLDAKKGDHYITGLLDKDWFRDPQTFFDAFLDLAVKKGIKIDNQSAVKDALFSGKDNFLDMRWTKKWQDIWDKFREDNKRFFSETTLEFMNSLLSQADDLARFMSNYKGLEVEYVITSPESFLPTNVAISELKKQIASKYSTTNSAQQNIDIAVNKQAPVTPITPVQEEKAKGDIIIPVNNNESDAQHSNPSSRVVGSNTFTPILTNNSLTTSSHTPTYYVGNDGIYVSTINDPQHSPISQFIMLGNSISQSQKHNTHRYPHNPFMGDVNDDNATYEGFALASLAVPLVKTAAKKVLTSPLSKKVLSKVSTTMGSKLPFIKKVVGKVSDKVKNVVESNDKSNKSSGLVTQTPQLDKISTLIGKDVQTPTDIENMIHLLTRDISTLLSEVKSTSVALSGVDAKLTLLVSKLLTSSVKPTFSGAIDDITASANSMIFSSDLLGAVESSPLSEGDLYDYAPVFLQEQYIN